MTSDVGCCSPCMVGLVSTSTYRSTTSRFPTWSVNPFCGRLSFNAHVLSWNAAILALPGSRRQGTHQLMRPCWKLLRRDPTYFSSEDGPAYGQQSPKTENRLLCGTGRPSPQNLVSWAGRSRPCAFASKPHGTWTNSTQQVWIWRRWIVSPLRFSASRAVADTGAAEVRRQGVRAHSTQKCPSRGSQEFRGFSRR